MKNSSNVMTRFNALIANTVRGELSTFGLAAGSSYLAWAEAITPFLGFLGVLLGVVAGVYTIMIKRKQLQHLNRPNRPDDLVL